MGIHIKGQVKDQMKALIKAHPDWLAVEILEATAACFPGEHMPERSYISSLRHSMGMGRYQKRSTKEKAKAANGAAKADEQLRFIPTTVEGKVHLLKVVTEALEKQLDGQRQGREVLRRLGDDNVGPGHPQGLYKEVR